MGYLGAILMQVFMRVCMRSRRVTQRYHNSPRWETGLGSVNDFTHAEDFGDFEKSQSSWVLSREKTFDFRLLAEALGRYRTRWGCRWKYQNRKNVYLSPYAEEPLNTKVIKSFIPEIRCRKCFSCFKIPMFYVYIYEHPMYISQIHVYGYGP